MLDHKSIQVQPPDRSDLSTLRTELMSTSTPVAPVLTYISYDDAYKKFSPVLGDLRPALITLSNGVGPYGACSRRSVADSNNPSQKADRITLRRDYAGPLVGNLSNLFRNMLRLSLYDDPKEKASRSTYFSAECCRRMDAFGLPTFVIDKRDGTKIYGKPGHSVHHEVNPEGDFARMCAAFLDGNNTVLYLDRALSESEEDENAARALAKKAESKTRFICPKSREEARDDSTKLSTDHYKLKCWARGEAKLHCGFCLTALTPG